MKKAKRGLVLKTETVQLLTSDLDRVAGGNLLLTLATLLCQGRRNPSGDPACTQ